MVLYQLKLQDQSSRNIWHTSTTDENSTKGRDPNINIINGIHKIKGKTSVNILVSNYTNKHVTFNKGEYIGHLEPTILDDTTIDDSESHSTNSITLQKMMAEQVQPDIFDPPHYKLKPGIQSKLDILLLGQCQKWKISFPSLMQQNIFQL